MRLQVSIEGRLVEQEVPIDWLKVPNLEARVSVQGNPPQPLATSEKLYYPVRVQDPEFNFQVVATPRVIMVPSEAISLSARQGSQARYLFRLCLMSRGMYNVVLGQFLPAGAQTSTHYHKKTREWHIPIAGEIEMHDHTNCRAWKLTEPHLTEPPTRHQLRAIRHSFCVIVMEGPYGTSMRDHYYE